MKLAIIGAGTMGRGIMQWAAEAGHEVLAFDARDGAAEAARQFAAGMFDRALAKGRMDAANRDAAAQRIRPVAALAGIASADIVIEAIVEDLDAKRAVFAEIEPVVGERAILCTNTSSLSVTACASRCVRPQMVAGLHFFNPVPLMKVVEVVRGERTEPAVVATLVDFVAGTGHRPVLCGDTPGFVVNHAGRGLYTEGLRIVREGVGGFADVDRVMRDCGGFPMGPFELFDLTGLDVSSRVLREIYESFFHERRHQPDPLVYRRVEAGLFGRKTGRGFYRYEDGRRVEPPEQPAPAAGPASFHLDSADEAGTAIAAALVAGGLKQVSGGGDVTVLTPLGLDATAAAVAGGHDARKVVAIDPLTGAQAGGRATLMSTPATDGRAVDAVHAALLAADVKVTRIADSPGFIAQRMLATIVNTSCEIAQQRIATPGDIDAGVKLGLGYPAGPLALGDRIGPARVLAMLDGLHACTGDQRYAPSPWLRRRATLGLSLSHPK